MKREFTAVFKKDGKWIAAWVEELPGVNTQGRTKKEARANLQEALALILEERAKLSKKETHIERESIRINIEDMAVA